MKKLYLAILFVFLNAIASIANGNTVVECYNCAKPSTISSWGLTNLSRNETQRITLVDLYNKEAMSFDVTLRDTPTLPGIPSVPMVGYLPAPVPSDIKVMMDDLNEASYALVRAAQSKTIPKTVIESPWEFVNCAYCRADVSNYLNGILQGKINTVKLTAVTIGQALGLINTSVPNKFLIELEAGGSILVELTVVNSPINLEVKILRVLDPDNNEVAQNIAELNGMNIKVSVLKHVEDMNNYLNPHGYGVSLDSLIFRNGFYRGRVMVQEFDYQ